MKILFPERRAALLNLVERLSPLDTEEPFHSRLGRETWESDRIILAEAGIEIPKKRSAVCRPLTFSSLCETAQTVWMKVGS